jgi:predicted Ser/Thr protein kinase
MNMSTKSTKADKITFVKIDESFYIPETYSGDFKGFLPFAVKNPATVESSHMRAFRLVAREGIDPVATEKARRVWGDPNLFAFNAFKDFHGIEPVIMKVVSALQSAAAGGEASYSILFMFGPPSSGKSQIANRMKKLFVDGEDGLMLSGSGMRAHPLTLFTMIPMLARKLAKGNVKAEADLRMQFLKALELDTNGILKLTRWDAKKAFERARVEPTLENLCAIKDPDTFVDGLVYGLGFSRGVRAIVTFPDFAVIDHLMAEADKGADAVISAVANYKLESFQFLGEKEGSVGVASLKESEPLKYDKSEMIGEDNLNRFGEDNPPDSHQVILNGLYNNAHRGMAEIVEAAKNSIMAFRTMLDASQDKSIPAPAPKSNRALGIDCLIFAHTNEDELKKMLADPGNAPYQDRFIMIESPHVVAAPEITKVLDKMWGRSNFGNPESPEFCHLEPSVNPMLSRFLAYTRQIADKDINDPMIQIEILGGDYFRLKESGTKYDVKDIHRRAGSRQGMSGATNRLGRKLIDERAAVALLNGRHSITSEEVMEALKLNLRTLRERAGEKVDEDAEKANPSKSPLGTQEAFVKNALTKWRAKRLARDVRLAMVQEGLTARDSYAAKYVDVVEQMLTDESSVSNSDKQFARDIEAELGVTSSQAERFRDEIRQLRSAAIAARDAHEQKHGDDVPLPHTFYAPIARAIDRVIMKKMPVSTAVDILRAEKTGNTKQKEDLKGVLGRMVQFLGYDEYTAREVCKEVERNGYMELLDTNEEF